MKSKEYLENLTGEVTGTFILVFLGCGAVAASVGINAVSLATAMFAEGIGTFMLVLMIFLLTEKCNLGRPENSLAPVFIGATVTVIICLIAPLTQAGLNPARDFGPRLFAYLSGWKNVAIPGPKGGFLTVYILAPILGGLLAALCFTKVIEPLMNKSSRDNDSCCKG